jgi:hypothetical protein
VALAGGVSTAWKYGSSALAWRFYVVDNQPIPLTEASALPALVGSVLVPAAGY